MTRADSFMEIARALHDGRAAPILLSSLVETLFAAQVLVDALGPIYDPEIDQLAQDLDEWLEALAEMVTE